MPDIKQTTHDLEQIVMEANPWREFPPVSCSVPYSLLCDVLDLLKEQDAKLPGGDSGMCEICSFFERSLPVKPKYNARTNWYECGSCHFSMTSGMHCKGELIPAYKVGFCAKCGRAVKWDA